MAKKPVRKLQTRSAVRLEPKTARQATGPQRRVAAVVQTSAAPLTFKQRLARLMLPAAPSKSSVDAAQLAAVRQGVMAELRRHNTPGQPFQNVMLPEGLRRERRRGMPLWAIGTLTALAVLAALVWWAGRPPAGAELALRHIEDAITTKNTAEFERLVDTPTLSANVIAQVFTPTMQSADKMMADQFEASVRAHLQSFFKPGQNVGLADTLHDQILAAVSAGRWPEEPGNLLSQLWQQLGGDQARVGDPRIVSSMPSRVEAELPMSRNDIDMDVALRLVLEKKDNQWQLVDMPNLAQALGLVSDAETATANTSEMDENISPAAGPVSAVTVDVLQAAKDNRGHVVARLNLANMSGLPVHGLDMALIIGDADGRPLKQVLLHETAALAPTESAEKTYTVALDTKKQYEKYIANLPLTALTVRVAVISVGQ